MLLQPGCGEEPTDMRNLIGQAFSELGQALFGIVLFLWWVGGPGVTAIVWSQGEKTLALQFFAMWVVVTALYIAVRMVIRRARRR
ncbi:hypothetical protein [Streptomyces sp. NPDC026294]|uniref:hypothetical protein n=1 Tax=unclassified Streptomyces TaxID=2593676 RepID=UPI0033C6C0B2